MHCEMAVLCFAHSIWIGLVPEARWTSHSKVLERWKTSQQQAISWTVVEMSCCFKICSEVHRHSRGIPGASCWQLQHLDTCCGDNANQHFEARGHLSLRKSFVHSLLLFRITV